VINPGLTLLIRLNARGLARASWRRLKTAKGAITALVMAPFILLVVASQLSVAFVMPAAELSPPDPATIRPFVGTFGMLLLVTEAWNERALALKPQELDFLFPAPVSRRELLAYHLLSRFPVRLLSALWIALFTMRLSAHPLGGLLAPILMFGFLHVATELIALLGAASSAWAGPWKSRVFWTVLAGTAVWSVASAVGTTGTPRDAILAALETPAMRVLTLPMRPFALISASPGVGGVLAWTAVAVFQIAAATGLIFALDVAYSERAAAASRRMLERLKRAGAGQAVGVARPWKLRVRLPMPRMLGGGAPLAWRQALELVRNPRALFLPLLLPALYIGFFMGMPALRGESITAPMAIGAIGVSVLVPLLLPNVGFDFRRDMDRMAALRALPLRPIAVAAGQIFAPTLAFVVSQVLVVAVAAAVSRALSPLWVIGSLALGIPLTWLIVALDNLLFLWMPYRFSTEGSQNVQFAGKTMVILAIKLFALFVLAVLAALASRGAWWATGGSPAAMLAAAATVMFLGCIPLTWAAGALFNGFDLASDLPA